VENLQITRAVYQDFLITKLLPDIARMWATRPENYRRGKIVIQQDNAPAHRINMVAFEEAWRLLGLTEVELRNQPAQSPDFNVCDLSFFPSIQSLYHKIPGVKDSMTCIEKVKEAFEKYDPNLLNRSFLSLLMNYNEALKHNGCNKFAVPHMGKERLERAGLLPTTLMVWKPSDEVPDGLLNNDSDDDELSLLDDPDFQLLYDPNDQENRT
jgi:hypothetical protein